MQNQSFEFITAFKIHIQIIQFSLLLNEGF